MTRRTLSRDEVGRATGPRAQAAVHPALALQRAAGNAAVGALVQRLKGEATDHVLNHIFRGDSNKADDAITGYHSEHEEATAIAQVGGDRSAPGLGGVYTAAPVTAKRSAKSTSGKQLGDKLAGSSFFPKAWTRDQVKDVIEGAQRLRSLRPNRMGVGPGKVEVPLQVADSDGGGTIFPVLVAVEEASSKPGRGGKGGKGGKGARKK